jgi:integrase
MTAWSAPFLMRRGAIYYLRVRVPDDLVNLVGVREVRRSLGPMRFHEARQIAARTGSQLKGTFEMMRAADNLTKSEVRNLIRDCFAGLSEDRDRGFEPVSPEPDLEVLDQEGMASEQICSLSNQLSAGQFEAETVAAAKHMAATHKVDLDTVSDERLKIIVEGFVRAMIEAERLYMFRLGDRLAPYTPADPLFAGDHRDKEKGIGLTVDELIEEYCRNNKTVWTAKTLATHRPKLKLLSDFIGGDRRADTVTRDDLRPYPEALLRLRKNYHLSTGQTIQSFQTSAEHARIQPSTATTILARTTALFRWAYKKGYIGSNPAEGLSVSVPKAKKGHRSRRPFTKAELTTLFSAPLFTGSRTWHRLFEPGDVERRDAYFFVPVLGYYTGARLGELIQLHFADCVLDGPAPHICINENSDAKHGEEGYKHVKTDAGVRKIALHPDVMALGFAEYVKQQRKTAGPSKRVFHRIKFGADGQPSTVFSKWWGRFLDKVGLGDNALVFHSFRHTAEDYLRANKLPKYIIDQIIGHQDPSAAGEYGMGLSVEELHAIIADLSLPVRLPDLIASKPN